MKPGAPAVRFEIAKSDEDEQNVRADAVARGLVAGRPMMPQPNPRFWSLVIGRLIPPPRADWRKRMARALAKAAS